MHIAGSLMQSPVKQIQLLNYQAAIKSATNTCTFTSKTQSLNKNQLLLIVIPKSLNNLQHKSRIPGAMNSPPRMRPPLIRMIENSPASWDDVFNHSTPRRKGGKEWPLHLPKPPQPL